MIHHFELAEIGSIRLELYQTRVTRASEESDAAAVAMAEESERAAKLVADFLALFCNYPGIHNIRIIKLPFHINNKYLH